jgi:hypothetical protein
MAIKDWKFKEEDGFKPIAVGAHRCRIADAEVTVSKAGNDMIKLTLDISGHQGTIWNFITFMDDTAERMEMTNRMLTAVFKSFDIPFDDFDMSHWVGKVGACQVKHDSDDKAQVAYFLDRKRQLILPAWQEPNKPVKVAGFQEVDGEEIPF